MKEEPKSYPVSAEIAREIENAEYAYLAFWPLFKDLPVEHMWAVFLNNRNKPIGMFRISEGTWHSTTCDIAQVASAALLGAARGVLLMHNHPSGYLEPSPEDIRVTREVKRGLGLFGIALYDHLIFTDKGFTSLGERGLV